MALQETLLNRLNLFEWALIALTLYILQIVGHFVVRMHQALVTTFAVSLRIHFLTSPTYTRAVVGPGIKIAPSLRHVQIPADCVCGGSAKDIWLIVCGHSTRPDPYDGRKGHEGHLRSLRNQDALLRRHGLLERREVNTGLYRLPKCSANA
jgi:hypothetical protein